MKKVKVLLIFISLLLCFTLFSACDGKGEVFSQKSEINILVEESMDLFVGESTKISPIAIKDGKTFNTRFEFSSSDSALEIDNDGNISAIKENAPSVIYITIKDLDNDVEKKVTINIHNKISSIYDIVYSDGTSLLYDNSRNELTSKSIKFIYDETKTIKVSSNSGQFDISSYTTIETTDLKGNKKKIFDVSFDKNAINLCPTGFGEGIMYLNIKLNDGTKVFTFNYDIDYINSAIEESIFRKYSSISSSFTKDDINSLSYIAFENNDIATLQDLEIFKSLKTIVLEDKNSIASYSLFDPKYEYKVHNVLIYNYFNDTYWGIKDSVYSIFPYKDDIFEKYVVLHSSKSTELAIEKVDSTYNLPIYQSLGYKNSSWEDKIYNKVETKDLSTYTNGIHLFAVWDPLTLEVKFNKNDGSDEEAIQKIVTDTSASLNPVSFARKGYAFAGWSLTNNGSVEYIDKATFTLSVDKIDSNNNVTLYAVWDKNINKIVFHDNCGLNKSYEQEIPTDTESLLVENSFLNLGYSFLGWSTSESSSEVVYKDKANYLMGSESEYHLYAIWKPNKNTLVFSINYETEEQIVSKSIETNETIVLSKEIVDYSREGYSFLGWATTSNGAKIYDIDDEFTMNTDEVYTLYALWQPNINKLVFHPNTIKNEDINQQISTETEEQTFESGETKALKGNVFVNTGYKFKGWSTSKTGEVIYIDKANYTMGSNKEYSLYAIWELETYSITYNLAETGSNPISYNYLSGEIIINNPPTFQGYTFKGWYSDDGRTIPCNSINEFSTGAKIFYANWTANTQTLTLDSCIGKTEILYPLTDSEVSIQLNIFARNGYKLLGWSESNSVDAVMVCLNGGKYIMKNKNTTLYAVWKEIDYIINYELNGGTQNSNNPASYRIDSNDITLQSPTKTGYNFEGWYSDNGFTTNKVETISAGSYGNKELYAKFVPKEYYINYYKNNSQATGNMSSECITVGEQHTLKSNNYSYSGYKFMGWATSRGSSSVIYGNNATIIMGTSSLDLYAVWANFDYIITYVLPNNASNDSNNPKGYNSGANTISLYDAAKTGWTFKGWYNDSNYSSKIENNTLNVSNNLGDKTIYAKFEANVYTLNFNSNGGNTISSKKVIYDSQIGSLDTPSLHGYDFKGWYYGGVKFTSTKEYKYDKDITLEATWAKTWYSFARSTGAGTNLSITKDGVEYTNSTIEYGTVIQITYSLNGEKYYESPSLNKTGLIDNGDSTYTVDDNVSISTSATKTSCLRGDAPVLMPDGSTKAIRDLTYGDEIMTFNHMTGEIVPSKIASVFIQSSYAYITEVTFSNGLSFEIIHNGHGLFDLTLNQYVLVGESAEDYIGHNFLYYDVANNFNKVEIKLVDVKHYNRYLTYYDITTENSIDFIVYNMLSCSDVTVPLLNCLEFDNNQNYDLEQLDKDIETYGLYEYEEWADMLTKEFFDMYNAAYVKIGLMKGIITMEEILELINQVALYCE